MRTQIYDGAAFGGSLMADIPGVLPLLFHGVIGRMTPD
jgi:hypothetical protein